MRPTRIAMLSYHSSPLASLGGAKAGGMNLYVRRVAEQLAARGLLVDVFTRRDDPDAAAVVEMAPGARLVHIAAGPAQPLDTDDLFPLVDRFVDGVEAFRASEDVSYDLLHSHYWLSAVAGERLAERWDVPKVAMFHTLGDVKLRARASETEPQTRLDAERELVHSVDRIVVATEHERQLLRQLYRVERSRVVVIPQGVDTDQFQPRDQSEARRELDLPEDGKVLVAVGRVEPLKGFDILIRALAEMTERASVTLVIVGGDARAAAEFARLTAIAEEVGVSSQVRFVGATDHQRVAYYYNAADVVVVPSFYESFGLVALEALASGVPVVASRVGGLTSTVADGRNGYLIPWRCPEPFAEKIDLLLANPPLRLALGRAGVSSVERYSWANVATALLRLYEEMLGGDATDAGGRPGAVQPLVAGGAQS
jgi:D-inositol-3-phosphate glycosyltransferase